MSTPAASGSPRAGAARDRVVPFLAAFKGTLALHIDARRRADTAFLFESSWKKPYSDRGVRQSHMTSTSVLS
jgi:hypothetical protein